MVKGSLWNCKLLVMCMSGRKRLLTFAVERYAIVKVRYLSSTASRRRRERCGGKERKPSLHNCFLVGRTGDVEKSGVPGF